MAPNVGPDKYSCSIELKRANKIVIVSTENELGLKELEIRTLVGTSGDGSRTKRHSKGAESLTNGRVRID